MTPDLKTLADPDVFMLLDTVAGVLVASMCVWSMLCLATHNTGAVIVIGKIILVVGHMCLCCKMLQCDWLNVSKCSIVMLELNFS